MKHYLHVTLYCFDTMLIRNLMNKNSELKNKLHNYFLSNYAKNLDNLDDCTNVILLILDELYSEQRDYFINQIGYDLLSLCDVSPVTIFLKKFSKNTVIFDDFYNVFSMKNIFHINHGMFSSKMLPVLKDYYLDELNLYKSKKYIPILQHLLNHPIKDIDCDKIDGDGDEVYGTIYHYDISSIKEILKEIETTRTDIEHYLDKLGLYESFKHEYQFITRNDLYSEIIRNMRIVFPNNLLHSYERQIIDYIMLYFYGDKIKSYKNNILHIKNQDKQIINESKNFLKKYYKRTIFEKKYENDKDTKTIQETKDIIKLLHNQQSDLISSELIGYIGDTVDFNSFFVKPTVKTYIDPSIFIRNNEDVNNDLTGTTEQLERTDVTDQENNKSQTMPKYNLVLKTNDNNNIKSIHEIEQYLEDVMDDIYNKSHSFIISEFVNFKYEQCCFFRNGRIVGTTPCARKISFLHCYPNGRIHPYFVDNHNDDIDNLKLDRKMAAEMAWFIKAAARDYDQLQLKDGNQVLNRCGTIDVGYDMDKKEWKIIEIHYFEEDIFQSHAGLYAMNPFLFNPYNSNIKNIYSLNNNMLKINWRKAVKAKQADKNLLLIDLLEIKDEYQIPSNNLLLMLPSESLRSIDIYYKVNYPNFNLLELVKSKFKSTLIDYLDDYIKTHQSKNNIFEKLKFKKMIDVKISNEQSQNKMTVTLPFGTITITGLEFESTHLLVQSDFDKKNTKAFEIIPHQTHHQIIMNYLCELIVMQCVNIYNDNN